ncbi:MAG: porin family protein [Bacteroidales bacterium]
MKDQVELKGPGEIKQFSVSNELYKSSVIKSQITGEGTKSDNVYILDTVFLQTIVDGPKSLYYFLNELGEEFYILQDTIYELLVYKKYLKEIEGESLEYKTEKGIEKMSVGNSYTFVNNKYKGQLTFYLKDCNIITQKINNLKYDKKSLAKLFIDYYKCTDSKMTFYKEHDKLKAKFGVVAGVSFTNIKFEGRGFESLVNSEFKSTSDFYGGLFCNLIFPRNQQKWSIYNELYYTSFNTEGTYTETNNTYISVLNYSYIKMANLIQYSFPIGKVKMFGNAGISYGYAVKETNEQTVITKLSNSEIIVEDKAIQETKLWERGLTAGLGISFMKFNLQVRYDIGSGMSDLKTLSSKVNRLFLSLGYNF